MRFEVISVLAFGAGIAAAADDQGLLLKIEVTQQVSCSKQTKLGDTLHVNYNGTLTNGTLFDSSFDDEKGGWSPIEFVIGTGKLIKGWERGLLDMCVGERRKLTLGPQYAYGNRAVGPIPPNSTLVFTTELVRSSEGGSSAR